MILVIFFAAGNKKNIFIMKKKTKKNLVQKFGNLLLPNLYCEEGIVLQETGEKVEELYYKMSEFGLELYCNTVIVLQVGSAMCWKDCIAIGWVGWQLYCNTVRTEAGLKAEKTYITIQTYCIVTGQRRKGWTVLQYNTTSPGHGTAMRVARRGGAGMACAHAHDTARGALRHGRGPRPRYDWAGAQPAPATRPGQAPTILCPAPAIRPVPGHDTAGTWPRYDRPREVMRAPGRASAHLGVPAGPAGCSCTRLGFRPNFFRLGIVYESPFGPGS